MFVYGKNVARDLLAGDNYIKEVFLQDNFSDKDIIDLLKKKSLFLISQLDLGENELYLK